MTPEGKVKQEVKKILKRHGVWYCMPRGTTYGRSGVPDFLCCVAGKFLGIETKAGNNRPTALQTRELDAIAKAGGLVLVLNESNLEDLERICSRRENI